MKKLRLKHRVKGMISWPLCTFLLVQATGGQAAFNPALFVPKAEAFSGGNKLAKQEATKNKSLIKKKTRIKSKTRKKATLAKKKDPFYSSKLLQKIYLRQAKRMKRIDAYKKKGYVGESDSGLLKERDSSKLSKAEKKLFDKVIAVENSDRKKIIQQIEKGGAYSQEERQAIRRRLFEGYNQADPKGTYYFQADHWRIK